MNQALIPTQFPLGMWVTWKSIRGQPHQGPVVAVIPAGARPADHLPKGQPGIMFNPDAKRRQLSYIVAGSGGRLYRPMTNSLEPYSMMSGRATVSGSSLEWFGGSQGMGGAEPQFSRKWTIWLVIVPLVVLMLLVVLYGIQRGGA